MFVVTLVLTGGAALALFGYAAWGRVSPRARWIILLVALVDVALRGAILPAVMPGLASGAPLLLSLAAYMVVLTLIMIHSPPQLAPLALIPLMLGDTQLLSTLILSNTAGSVWALLLVGMVLLWRRPLLRALPFGIALALYPPVLLLLPILAIRLHRTDETWRAALPRFLLGAGAAWALLTLSFVVVEPTLWLAHLRDSVGLGDSSYGQGLAAAAGYGLLPLSADSVRLFAALVYGLLLVLLYRHYATFERAAWMFPAFVVWLLPNFPAGSWAFWLLPTLATLVRPMPARAALPCYAPRRTVVYAAGALAACIGIAALMIALPPRRLEASVRYPLGVDAVGRIVEIPVEVANLSDSPVVPAFEVRPWTAPAPARWDADDAPGTLAPGERAIYRLRNEREGFFALAQGVVEDGAGGTAARFTLGPYLDYGFPDALYNPTYDLWSLERDVPIGWSLVAQPAFAARAAPVEQDGRRGVALHLDALTSGLNTAALEVGMIFPYEPLGFWLYYDPPPGIDPATLLYGVEFVSGEQRALLLYGAQDAPALISPALYVARTAVEPRTWVYQEIDIAAIYAEAGWALPEARRLILREIEADLIPLTVRLTIGVTGSAGEVTGIFGPVVQRRRTIDPTQLMGETFADPAAYYALLGDQHLRERNYHLAQEAYTTALTYAPDDESLLQARAAARLLAVSRLPWLEVGEP
jgi:hypothetical protein